jgi:hypothetical protein
MSKIAEVRASAHLRPFSAELVYPRPEAIPGAIVLIGIRRSLARIVSLRADEQVATTRQ